MQHRLYYTLYNTLITLALFIGIPVWVIGVALNPKLQAGLNHKLGLIAPINPKTKKRIVLHAVSVGELMAARPIIDWLSQNPNIELVLSNITKTGHTLASQQYPQLANHYLPLDFTWALTPWFNKIAPDAIFILETELWPNLLAMAKQQGVPVVLINGRLSEKSFKGYAQLKGFFSWVLQGFTQLLMQSPEDAKRVIALGADSTAVSVMGNIKYCPPQKTTTPIEKTLHDFLTPWQTSPIVVFASTHHGEEHSLLELYQTLKTTYPTLKAIVVPRHPERFNDVWQTINTLNISAQRRSALNTATTHTDLLLLDSIGELTHIYPYAHSVVMGGSFVPTGGHNVLEPLYAGKPVIFGPHMFNFAAIAQTVLATGCAQQVQNVAQAGTALQRLLSDPAFYTQQQGACQHLFSQHQQIWPQLQQRLTPYL